MNGYEIISPQKIKMLKYKIILEKEDYDFIDYLVGKYKLPIGDGYKTFIEIAINEYKLKNIYKI